MLKNNGRRSCSSKLTDILNGGGLEPIQIGFKNCRFVQPGDDLLSAYNWLKSSARNTEFGVASQTNRRVLILTPGQHTLTDTLVLDTPYVDISALTGYGFHPIGDRFDDMSRRPDTFITLGVSGKNTIRQDVDEIFLNGFGIVNTGSATGTDTKTGNNSAFVINCVNDWSMYSNMFFDATHVTSNGGATVQWELLPVTAAPGVNLGGTWVHCRSLAHGWRMPYPGSGKTAYLKGKFYYCRTEYSGFGGDKDGVVIGGTAAGHGYFWCCEAGEGGFGGCSGAGCETNEYAEFHYCNSGNSSFSKGRTFAGKAYYCTAGYDSFGGNLTDNPYNNGKFSGYAKGCVSSGGAFGGNPMPVGSKLGGLTGVLEDCTCTGIHKPILIYGGGRVTGGRFSADTTSGDVDIFNLRDDTAQIQNTVVVPNGNGYAVTNEHKNGIGYSNDISFISGQNNTPTLAHPVKPSSIVITWEDSGGTTQTATDDGSGNIVGTGINTGYTHTINYTTGVLNFRVTSGNSARAYIAYSTTGVGAQVAMSGCISKANLLKGDVTNLITTAYNVADNNVK